MSDVYDNVSQFHAGKKLGGNALQKTMNSSVSANLSVWLGTRGMCMTVATACASGATAIGMAYRAIKAGWQDRMLAGGVQEGSWQYDCNFDALRGFSQREDNPARASRPFDRDRDGLVPSAGAGMVVLEEYDSAVARGVPVLAEVIGFATNSDGFDMVAPSGVGNRECMEFALADAGIKPGDVDYINAHATGTKVGDTAEAGSIAAIFGEEPLVSSTKGVTGHEIGAAGSNEFIYTLLMIRHGFAAPNVNLENVDDECRGVRYVGRQAQELAIETAVSNSFGFGGVNACLILKRSPS
jgi:3-oxoacyl-[acyl-carrier-protein] synthase-1